MRRRSEMGTADQLAREAQRLRERRRMALEYSESLYRAMAATAEAEYQLEKFPLAAAGGQLRTGTELARHLWELLSGVRDALLLPAPAEATRGGTHQAAVAATARAGQQRVLLAVSAAAHIHLIACASQPDGTVEVQPAHDAYVMIPGSDLKLTFSRDTLEFRVIVSQKVLVPAEIAAGLQSLSETEALIEILRRASATDLYVLHVPVERGPKQKMEPE